MADCDVGVILAEVLKTHVKDSVVGVNASDLQLDPQTLRPKRTLIAPVALPFLLTPRVSEPHKLDSLSVLVLNPLNSLNPAVANNTHERR